MQAHEQCRKYRTNEDDNDDDDDDDNDNHNDNNIDNTNNNSNNNSSNDDKPRLEHLKSSRYWDTEESQTNSQN